MTPPEHPAAGKAGPIRCIVFDVDGVLTDGRITLDGGGEEMKSFDVKDGLRMVLARRSGLKTALITGRQSAVVARRAGELGTDHLYQGAGDKVQCLQAVMSKEGLGAEGIAFLGDDLPDLPAMKAAGLAGAVADAVPEVRDAADWISSRPGGRGAAGEFVEFILRVQGRWEGILNGFGA